MPLALQYLGIMLAIICVWFLVFKRPVYEAVLLSFAILLTLTGNWHNLPSYFEEAMSTSLLYSMVAFMAMSVLLTKTKVIDGAVAIILSLFGRIPGGAGYASVVASAFMGALSGSGPGNVMATGTITIPAMKRSGFPAELAANVESNASYLGNMIPPSNNIFAAMAAYAIFAGSEPNQGNFIIAMWGLSLWFVLEKILIVWGFCKYYKVKPMAKEDIPKLSEVFKSGWQGLLLPVIILLPFVLDSVCADFFAARLGAAGAKAFSSSLLLFVAGVGAIYACLVVKDKKTVTPHKIATMFGNSVKSIAPAIAVCVFGYMIGGLFDDLQVAAEMNTFIQGMQFGRFGMVVFICLVTCFLGMVIPGSALTTMFGAVFISTLNTVGVDPMLTATMLPCICGVMCGITPPLALGMYAGMTVAESDFSKTVKNDLWWVAAHFVLEVIVLMGFLPIIGL